MGLFHQIANYFKPRETKTIVVTPAEPGDAISISSLNDQVIILPCPFPIRLAGVCICATCDFVIRPCPMEMLCRNSGCEGAFIKGCTSYKNKEDFNEEKKRVFKNGTSFGGTIFYFTGRKSQESPTI